MAQPRTVQIGVPLVMAIEDEVFAMPIRRTIGFVNPVAATLEISDAVAGTYVPVDVDASDGRFETAAPFIRNGTGTDCTIILKAN